MGCIWFRFIAGGDRQAFFWQATPEATTTRQSGQGPLAFFSLHGFRLRIWGQSKQLSVIGLYCGPLFGIQGAEVRQAIIAFHTNPLCTLTYCIRPRKLDGTFGQNSSRPLVHLKNCVVSCSVEGNDGSRSLTLCPLLYIRRAPQ
jgi:hypothetical protein